MRVQEQKNSEPAQPGWKNQVVAGLVGCHFLIILTGAFAAQPSSRLQQMLANKFLAYYQFFDLGQGYRFYAPRPAPTAIITAKLKIRDENGKIDYETVRIPDRNTWPRLRLQRQLAMANSLWGEYERSLTLPDGHQHKPLIARAFARHIGKSVKGCESVELFLHRNPNPRTVEMALRRGQVLTHKDLEDESFNTPIESLGAFPCE